MSGGEMRSVLHHVLEDTSTVNPYHAEQRWAGARNVYYALTLNDSLMLGDTVLIAFYDSSRVANIGKLDRATNALRSPKDAAKYKDTLSAISTSIIPEGAWRDVLLVAFEHATDTSTVVDGLMQQVISVLDSIFPDSTFASPRTKAKAWSGSHRSTLESIAEECPYEYGNAVHMARAILSQYDTIPYYGVNICVQWAGPPSGKQDGNDQSETTDLQGDDEMSFNLYPNPNIGRFTVTLDVDETDRAEMTIWNVTGQQVYSSKLEVGSNAIHVNVAQGLYIYRVLVNGVSKWTGKISISSY